MRKISGMLILGLLCTGCGSDDRPAVYPVAGKIMYQGKPVEGASVNFHTDASPRVANATTNTEGEFELTTYDTGDGAVEGDHVVTVSKLEPKGEQKIIAADTGGDAYAKAMSTAVNSNYKGLTDSKLPEKFASKDTSGITRTVVADETNSFTIELK